MTTRALPPGIGPSSRKSSDRSTSDRSIGDGNAGDRNPSDRNPSARNASALTTQRTVWRVLGGVVMAVLVLVGGSTAWGRLARQTTTTQHTYWQPISVVEVDSDSATVRIQAGAPDRVTVGEFLDWALRRPSVSQTVTAGILKISVNCHSPLGVTGCGATLDIEVPAATSIRTQDNTGSTRVRGVSGEVRGKTTSGQLWLDGVSGPVWARATSGEIIASGLASQVVQVAVSSGRVSLGFGRPPQTATVTSSSGSVRVLVPTTETRYRVDGRTTSGSWEVDPAVVDSASGHVLDVTTTSGPVAVVSTTP